MLILHAVSIFLKAPLAYSPCLTDCIHCSNYEGTITQTVRAHRLSLKALKLGGQQMQGTLLRNIHKAYFEDNRNIGDFDVLSDLAQASGVMSKDEVRRESIPRKHRGFADAFKLLRCRRSSSSSPTSAGRR